MTVESKADKYAAISGLEAADAKSAEFALVLFAMPPWCLESDELCLAAVHTPAEIERFTATMRDKEGHQMYFYRKSDGTFWERMHIPTDSSANADIWSRIDDYIRITK